MAQRRWLGSYFVSGGSGSTCCVEIFFTLNNSLWFQAPSVFTCTSVLLDYDNSLSVSSAAMVSQISWQRMDSYYHSGGLWEMTSGKCFVLLRNALVRQRIHAHASDYGGSGVEVPRSSSKSAIACLQLGFAGDDAFLTCSLRSTAGPIFWESWSTSLEMARIGQCPRKR